MVYDQNPIAWDRMFVEYNIGATTSFFCGGYRVHISVNDAPEIYDSIITESGLRPVPSIDLITALDWLDDGIVRVRARVSNGLPANVSPISAVPLSGPATGLLGISYEYEFQAYDGDGDSLFYRVSWGDGDTTEWLGGFGPSDTLHLAHTWPAPAYYTVTSQTKDVWEASSEWAPGWSTGIGVDCCGARGDIDHGNGPSPVDISDLVFLVDYMFTGGAAPPCPTESDLNADTDTDIADLVYLVDFMFSGGAPPADCE